MYISDQVATKLCLRVVLLFPYSIDYVTEVAKESLCLHMQS